MDPQLIIQKLAETTSPDAAIRTAAERFLETASQQPGFSLVLLSILTGEGLSPTVQQAAALYLMTLVKRNWVSDDGQPTKIWGEDRINLKNNLLVTVGHQGLIPQVNEPLCETLAEIAKIDFVQGEWQELIPQLAQHFATQNFAVITRALRTLHTLFKRYRFEGKTDELWTEIKYVLDVVAAPLTQLFLATVEMAGNPGLDAGMLHNVYTTLHLISKVFYSLNFQDLPEFFEEHIKEWFGGFHTLLTAPPVPALAPEDDDHPGVIEDTKMQIIENLILYSNKYDEEFKDHVSLFVQDVWGLLQNTDLRMANDAMVSVAMRYLSIIVERPMYKDIFAEDETLRLVCEKIVVPNMLFRECDEELFEDNFEEYVRRDIEGSDVDTRRRGATDLVRGLTIHFEAKVTEIFSGYIQHLLAEFEMNQAQNWKSKDAAIFLATSMAMKGKVQGRGVTTVNQFINILDFFSSSILPHLQSEDVNESPVLKADCLKFVLNFRSQMTRDHHMVILPLVVRLLTASSLVVMSYAAYYIERILIQRGQDGVQMFDQAAIGGFAQELLTNLFGAMGRPECAENEYLMKAIMRTITAGKASLVPVMGLVIDALSQKMMEVSKNPGKAKFNHYMFEAMSGAVRFTCETHPEMVTAFEDKLFEPFGFMLTAYEGVGIPEFQPYVFQILAQMLEAHKPNDISGNYEALFPFLIKSDLWESGANTSPLVRLLQAYIHNSGETLLSDKVKLEGILGIYSKLCASKTNDHEGFKLVGSVLTNCKEDVLRQYIPAILNVCMARLSKLKTVKFIRGTLWLVCLLVGKYGGSYVVNSIEQMQQGLWKMLMTRLLSEIDSLPKEVERKVVAVGLTKLLTETPEMIQNYVNDIWPLAVQAIVKIFELEAEKEEDEENQLAELEAKGYQAKFAKLVYSSQRDFDPFTEVNNSQQYFSTQLYQAGQKIPELSSKIPADLMPHVTKYMQSAGIAGLPC